MSVAAAWLLHRLCSGQVWTRASAARVCNGHHISGRCIATAKLMLGCDHENLLHWCARCVERFSLRFG